MLRSLTFQSSLVMRTLRTAPKIKHLPAISALHSFQQRNMSRSVRDAPEGLKPWQIWGLRIFGYFGAASIRIRQAQAIYRSCMQQADSPSLRRALQLPLEGFAPQHQLILIHVWIVNKRLLKEGKRGKKLQKELFDTLWENSERRVRRAGIPEMSISKNMAEVQKVSFGAMISYDIGLKKMDDNEQELGSAVWRNLYASKEDIPDDRVLAVTKWMRSEVERVMQLPLSQIEEGMLDWTFPEGVIVTDDDKKFLIEQGLDGEWRQAIAVSGQPYWWNTRTRESQWEKPNVEKK